MNLNFRQARRDDLAGLVQMLADDKLGSSREDSSEPINPRYMETFGDIEQDPNNELIVVENEGELVGMLQLTFIPYLTHIGSRRCLIESVRIHSNFRGLGLGSTLIKWAIKRAKQRNCSIVQLTSDKQRPDALKFYQSLDFVASHEGFKLNL